MSFISHSFIQPNPSAYKVPDQGLDLRSLLQKFRFTILFSIAYLQAPPLEPVPCSHIRIPHLQSLGRKQSPLSSIREENSPSQTLLHWTEHEVPVFRWPYASLWLRTWWQIGWDSVACFWHRWCELQSVIQLPGASGTAILTTRSSVQHLQGQCCGQWHLCSAAGAYYKFLCETT